MSRKPLPEKQSETLERMRETRKADTLFLRIIIEKKLAWAKAEHEKGIEVINKQMQQIRENKEILSKLESVISVLEELLVTKKEEVKEE